MADDYEVVFYECKQTDAGGTQEVRCHAVKYYYDLTIVTGQQEGAGTSDTGVFVRLIGSKGQSSKIYLQNFLKVLIGKGIKEDSHDTLTIESSGDIGEILVVILGNDKCWLVTSGAPWYVNEVLVHNLQNKERKVFPCYHWIGDNDYISFTAQTAIPKDVAKNQVLCKQRQMQLKKRRAEYVWQEHSDWGLPSSISDTYKKLPQDEKFERVKDVDFTITAITNKLKIRVHAAFTDIKDIDDYKRMTNILDDPEFKLHEAARWVSDVEFGRQVLNGINPVIIERCTSLPSNFPVTNDIVKGQLNRGLTLEEEIKAGCVYICDLKIMDGLPLRKGQYCAAPICLLYVNGNTQLVPIAIQLKQQPGEDNPIFLPTDNWVDWLLAKTFYQSAQTQFHQLSTHFFSCHAAMEAYGMATMRNLPDSHPIFKLLRPHFHYTMAINSRGRATLMNDEGVLDKMFAIGGKGKVELYRRISAVYSIHWTNIRKSCKRRGVDDSDKLPGYYYRDDGSKVWKAIKTLAREVVNEFYKTDVEVEEDDELRDWAKDIHNNGFPGYYGAEVGHDFPKQINDKKTLIQLCTLIIFTGSAQHASVNFGQYEIFSFVPNAPATMCLPPPEVKGKANYETLLKTLPNEEDAGLQVATAHLLSRFSKDEVFLGNYPARRFTETVPQEQISKFKGRLDDITAEILERNKKLDIPYVNMLPTKIPNSITI